MLDRSSAASPALTLHRAADQHRVTPACAEVPVHRAESLTRGGPLAQIQLFDQTYTLRITRAGKLILTK